MNTFAPMPLNPELALAATVVTPLPVTDAGGGTREWTVAMVETSARQRGVDPETRLLAIFDVLDELFNRADREARAFVEVLAEMSTGRALDDSRTEILVSIRALVDTLAEEANLADIDDLASSWRILMKGAIVRAMDGDLESAARARVMAVDLIARHRAATATAHPVTEEDPDFSVFDFDTYMDDNPDVFAPELVAVTAGTFPLAELTQIDFLDEITR